MKFTPAAADYGLVFDATSSTPTSGTRFAKTEWDFGNGVKRAYNGSPKIERVRYGLQGDYTVTLRLTTNEGKTVTKYFSLFIRDPIATIEVNRQDGYIGDSFTFSAKASAFYKDLNYNWEILDIENDKLIYQKTDKTITYEFTDKGRYNSVTKEFTLNDGVSMTDEEAAEYRKAVSSELERQFYYSAMIIDTDYYSIVVDR